MAGATGSSVDVSATNGMYMIETSTLNANTTAAPTYPPDIQEQIDHYNNINKGLRLYITPFIIFGGTIGNILTIVVVLSRHFRYTPSSVLLLALAIVDIGALYFNLLDIWIGAILDSTGPFTRNQGVISCKIHVFLTYFLTHSSSWILVLINIDRVISVYQPLRARTLCTKKHLGLALLGMFIFLALVSTHVFWTVNYFDEFEDYKCFFDSEVLGSAGESAWVVLDACLFTYAPFIIILFCNIAIIWALVQAARRRRSDMNVRTTSSSKDSTHSITIMLITISIVFLVTTTPLTVTYSFYDTIVAKYENDPVGYALYFDLIINTVLVLLCYNNNAVNFLLYCVSGSKFRRALMDLCGGKKRRAARAEPYTTNTSMSTRHSVGTNKFTLTDMRKIATINASNGHLDEPHPHQYVNQNCSA